MEKNYETLTPTQKLVMFCNAVIDQDWETADAIEKDLGLDKVPYSEGD